MRMSAWYRDHIVHEAVKETFKARRKKQDELRTIISSQLAAKAKGKHVDVLRALPGKFLANSGENSVHVRIAIGTDVVGFNISKTYAKGVPDTRGAMTSLTTSSRLAKQLRVYGDEERKISSEARNLKRQLTAAVGAFSTVKRLRDEWPEMAKYLPSETRNQLPAVNVGDINAQINKLANG